MSASSSPPPASGAAATGRFGAADEVIGILIDEHLSLRYVLRMLERLLHDVAELDVEPDFRLLCAALYYIDQFPERVHHRREDEHLFTRLRTRTGEFDAVLDRLQREHAHSPQFVMTIERELVHYQGGAPQGLARLRTAVDAYAGMLDGHMRTEEVLFEAARPVLAEEEWRTIREAFEAQWDPLLRGGADDEFRRLRERIANALPRRMRFPRRGEPT
jgi:hemerythrin-like domain-containing protein